jgi:SAM-dependent methyltransferase
MAGDLASALSSYLTALSRAPTNANYLYVALSLVGMTDGYVLPPSIRKIFAAAAAARDFNCQSLVTVVHSTLVADPSAQELMNLAARGGDALEEGLRSARFDVVLSDALLRVVMRRAVIVSPEIESLLTALRRHALERAASSEPSCLFDEQLEFFANLAAQCFNTEYAYAIGGDEEVRLEAILADVPREAGPIALIAAYRPLYKVFDDLPARAGDGFSALEFLLQQQIVEPRDERALQEQIAVLTPAATALSERVRTQYEMFPYPRWFAVEGGRPRPFNQVIQERFPDMQFSELPENGVDVLLPGCGTGHQIAQVTTVFKSPRITAFDLSLTALAYAQRKLDDLDIDVHRLAQADILALDGWDERFDYIECIGVLHHLELPDDGLGILARLLRPHGIMRLALYSDRARQHVVAARKLVAAHGLADTVEGIRAARRLIAELPKDDPIRGLVTSHDFYSISGLHDLVFNVREHRYTPFDLNALLASAGLEFLGFDHIDPGVPVCYRELYPADKRQTDLAKWDDFERAYPKTFVGMYQLWCRRHRPTEAC